MHLGVLLHDPASPDPSLQASSALVPPLSPLRTPGNTKISVWPTRFVLRPPCITIAALSRITDITTWVLALVLVTMTMTMLLLLMIMLAGIFDVRIQAKKCMPPFSIVKRYVKVA